eukprot:NODE_25_length_3464_cov_16.028111_g19_i0.p2 GENE.NODE_25_length_3464_cov_16.028111_g19_i0~~NODE_25_length_3464_cov_16.028111_g19_i0.p2  ORF type:complete len:595 (-),score=259.59 NODE_25_length_3464_cov_16.028111_g19_i0:129-1913(-)
MGSISPRRDVAASQSSFTTSLSVSADSFWSSRSSLRILRSSLRRSSNRRMTSGSWSRSKGKQESRGQDPEVIRLLELLRNELRKMRKEDREDQKESAETDNDVVKEDCEAATSRRGEMLPIGDELVASPPPKDDELEPLEPKLVKQAKALAKQMEKADRPTKKFVDDASAHHDRLEIAWEVLQMLKADPASRKKKKELFGGLIDMDAWRKKKDQAEDDHEAFGPGGWKGGLKKGEGFLPDVKELKDRKKYEKEARDKDRGGAGADGEDADKTESQKTTDILDALADMKSDDADWQFDPESQKGKDIYAQLKLVDLAKLSDEEKEKLCKQFGIKDPASLPDWQHKPLEKWERPTVKSKIEVEDWKKPTLAPREWHVPSAEGASWGAHTEADYHEPESAAPEGENERDKERRLRKEQKDKEKLLKERERELRKQKKEIERKEGKKQKEKQKEEAVIKGSDFKPAMRRNSAADDAIEASDDEEDPNRWVGNKGLKGKVGGYDIWGNEQEEGFIKGGKKEAGESKPTRKGSRAEGGDDDLDLWMAEKKQIERRKSEAPIEEGDEAAREERRKEREAQREERDARQREREERAARRAKK